METKLKMIHWKGDKFWAGKLLDHPEIMTRGRRWSLSSLVSSFQSCSKTAQRYVILYLRLSFRADFPDYTEYEPLAAPLDNFNADYYRQPCAVLTQMYSFKPAFFML